jgi:GcrA cell cycle regulator
MTYWDPTNEVQLRALVDAGKSALQIAQALGGISRNAVIGKCTRMGLRLAGSTGAAKASAARPRTAKQSAPRPRVVMVTPVVVAPPLSRQITLMDLGPSQCKWPSGGGVPYTFCGAPMTHQAYCTYHARMAYQPKENGK